MQSEQAENRDEARFRKDLFGATGAGRKVRPC